MKRAFTLIEVNLAIMVMAVGVLGIISLYSLGYREERQSREDVASASYADAVMGPLVTALTATNVKWSAFRKIPDSPGAEGWGRYIQNRNTGKIVADPETLARQAYTRTLSSLGLSSFPSAWPVPESRAGDLKAALVVMHDEDSAVVRISFRATGKENLLFAAPLYYTEARFQGVVDE
jgi:type II secretory pathway pseudopilin PulG